MFSPFPPGWPALLAVGEWAQLGAWVNPLVACFPPWVAYRVAMAISDRQVARLAAVAMALSPGVLILAGSRMSHTSVLLGLGVLAVTVLSPSPRRLLGAAAAAYVVLARPYDAVTAGPLPLYGLPSARRDRALAGDRSSRSGRRTSSCGTTCSSRAVRGAFRCRFGTTPGKGVQGATVSASAMAFWVRQPLGLLGHTPVKALSLGAEYGSGLTAYLGVSGGSILAAVGAWRLRDKRLWLWVGMLVVLGYALYRSPEWAAWGALLPSAVHRGSRHDGRSIRFVSSSLGRFGHCCCLALGPQSATPRALRQLLVCR